MKRGLRREANHTLSMLVRAIKNPAKHVPSLSKHLASPDIKEGDVVVKKGTTWTNAGKSIHARSQETVLEVTDGIATCQYDTKVPAYDVMDGKGEWHFAVETDDIRATDRSELTQPGGNRHTPRFKSGTTVEMKTHDGQIVVEAET